MKEEICSMNARQTTGVQTILGCDVFPRIRGNVYVSTEKGWQAVEAQHDSHGGRVAECQAETAIGELFLQVGFAW